MTLVECDLNRNCEIISVNIEDEKLKIRLMEIGFFISNIVSVSKRSVLKRTMLVDVLDSCFAIKSDMAKLIEVEYV